MDIVADRGVIPYIARPTFVSFDVRDDIRRSHTRDLLRSHGDWLQRSLWIASPSTRRLPSYLATKLASITTTADRLVIHRPCLTCLSFVQIISPRYGLVQETNDDQRAMRPVRPAQLSRSTSACPNS